MQGYIVSAKNKNNVNWKKIEEQLYHLFFTIHFKLDGHKITIKREKISDTKCAYVVYIDNYIKGEWNTENFPIIKKVWCKSSKNIYTRKQREKFIKIFGKRDASKKINLDEKIVSYKAFFLSSKRWINQFKKLEGLEQVDL